MQVQWVREMNCPKLHEAMSSFIVENCRNAESRLIAKVFLNSHIMPYVFLNRKVMKGPKFANAMRTFFCIKFSFKNRALLLELSLVMKPPAGYLSNFFVNRHPRQEILDAFGDRQRCVFIRRFCLVVGRWTFFSWGEANNFVWIVSGIYKVSSAILSATFALEVSSLNARLAPSVPHVLTVPIGIDVGDRKDDIYIVFNV